MVQHDGFESLQDAAQYLLYAPLNFMVPDGKAKSGGPAPLIEAHWVPSGLLGVKGLQGPTAPRRVMVLGKMPNLDDAYSRQLMVGGVGDLFRKTLRELDMPDWENWYVTYVARFALNQPVSKLKPCYTEACAYLLAQELALTRPSYLLLLGADAVKAVFGSKTKMDDVRSHVFVLPDATALGQPPIRIEEASPLQAEYGIKVLVSISPGQVLKEAGYTEGFQRDLNMFKHLLLGASTSATPGAGCDYRYLTTPAELSAVIEELIAADYKQLTVDCEWGGPNYYEGWLRMVQFAWAPRTGVVVKLRDPSGKLYGTEQQLSQLYQLLRKLFDRPGMQICGHNIRADGKWLESAGVPILSRVAFDTMLADHLLNESAEHGLEALAVRYTDMGRYDLPVHEWCTKNGLTGAVLHEQGYALIPDELLQLYSAGDVDATFRCWIELERRLKLPENHGLWQLFQTIVMPCTLPIHEIEMSGVLVDQDRIQELTRLYGEKKVVLEQGLKDTLGMAEFNPRSTQQVQKLLFGPEEEGGLGLEPYKTTGKPARMWVDLEPEDRARVSPSTDIETLESLAGANPVVDQLRDYKIIDQVCKTFLRPAVVDDRGYEVYDKGLISFINPTAAGLRPASVRWPTPGGGSPPIPTCRICPRSRTKSWGASWVKAYPRSGPAS